MKTGAGDVGLRAPVVAWADDLSGAANMLAPFTEKGFRTALVTLESGGVAERFAEATRVNYQGRVAVCFDANVREGGAELLPWLPRPVMLKIDSLGRGEIARLVQEAARRFPYDAIVLAPAWPSQERCLRNGIGVGGTDWNEILEEIRLAVHPVPVRLANESTDFELEALVKAASDGVLWVGSQGIAQALAAGAQSREPSLRHRPDFTRGERGTLVVVGSREPLAVAQAKFLKDAGWADLSLESPVSQEEADRAIRELSAGRGVIGSIGGESPSEWEKVFESQRETIAALWNAAGGIVATGGATGSQLLRLQGESILWDVSEDARGVARSRLPDGRVFATQPGSVGTESDFLEVISAQKTSRTEREKRMTMPALRRVREQQVTVPTIVVTMGDPAGIGPEIIAKAFSSWTAEKNARLLVAGDVATMREAVRVCGLDLEVTAVASCEEELPGNTIPVVQTGPAVDQIAKGRLSAEAGEAAYQYIAQAVELAMSGAAQAICTAPINKAALQLAGRDYAGHTELLAELTGGSEVSMMLTAKGLRVIHVTTHVGLIDAIARIEPGLVERTIRRGDLALRRAGISVPRIGVLAINPHAGENGMFGRGEEAEKITPAVEACAAAGIDCVGPLPADTAFFRAMRGDFDLLVAMYHDQGHGPVKAVGLDDGVNITVGLPVIRTSVDHGTAFDIAGTGLASEQSFLTAIDAAVELAGAPEPVA